MSHLEIELQLLKQDILEMMSLVIKQLHKGKEAILKFDLDLAKEIIVTENRVNATELKIDRDSENIFALFNPVAVDLRFVLAALKINSNLERNGDNAEGIARYLLDLDTPFGDEMLKAFQLEEMYNTAISMMEDAREALDKEDTRLARRLFQKDDFLDKINRQASKTTLHLIKSNPEKHLHCLNLLSIIRKLERIGDQSKNIAEEIIFYIEAKVLKHKT